MTSLSTLELERYTTKQRSVNGEMIHIDLSYESIRFKITKLPKLINAHIINFSGQDLLDIMPIIKSPKNKISPSIGIYDCDFKDLSNLNEGLFSIYTNEYPKEILSNCHYNFYLTNNQINEINGVMPHCDLTIVCVDGNDFTIPEISSLSKIRIEKINNNKIKFNNQILYHLTLSGALVDFKGFPPVIYNLMIQKVYEIKDLSIFPYYNYLGIKNSYYLKFKGIKEFKRTNEELNCYPHEFIKRWDKFKNTINKMVNYLWP